VLNNPRKYTDPSGNWLEGDEKMTPEAQAKIIALTNKWDGSMTSPAYQALAKQAAAVRSDPNSWPGNTSNSATTANNNPGPRVEISRQLMESVSRAYPPNVAAILIEIIKLTATINPDGKVYMSAGEWSNALNTAIYVDRLLPKPSSGSVSVNAGMSMSGSRIVSGVMPPNLGDSPTSVTFALGSVKVDLGKGWTARIEQHGSGDGMQRHVHVYSDNKRWAQNEDGSPHDGGSNSSGSPPKKVLEELKKQKGWDWNQKEQDWLGDITINYLDIPGMQIIYPSGREVTVIPINYGFTTFPNNISKSQLIDYYTGPTVIDFNNGKSNSTPYPPIMPPIPNPAPIPIPMPKPIPIPIFP